MFNQSTVKLYIRLNIYEEHNVQKMQKRYDFYGFISFRNILYTKTILRHLIVHQMTKKIYAYLFI